MDKSSYNQKHYSLLTIVIGIIVAIGRIELNSNNEEDITTIMAVVNIVAFGFVFIIFSCDVYNLVKDRILKSGKNTKDKKYLKIILEIVFLIFLGIFAYFGIKYVASYRCATYNDVISIIALALSIANDGFVKCVENPTYQFICLINKFFYKAKNIVHIVIRSIQNKINKIVSKHIDQKEQEN